MGRTARAGERRGRVCGGAQRGGEEAEVMDGDVSALKSDNTLDETLDIAPIELVRKRRGCALGRAALNPRTTLLVAAGGGRGGWIGWM
jgi:hypothetical protein